MTIAWNDLNLRLSPLFCGLFFDKRVDSEVEYRIHTSTSQIAKFMGPTWSPPESCRPQMGPMLSPWPFLSGLFCRGLTEWNKSDNGAAKNDSNSSLTQGFYPYADLWSHAASVKISIKVIAIHQYRCVGYMKYIRCQQETERWQTDMSVAAFPFHPKSLFPSHPST